MFKQNKVLHSTCVGDSQVSHLMLVSLRAGATGSTGTNRRKVGLRPQVLNGTVQWPQGEKKAAEERERAQDIRDYGKSASSCRSHYPGDTNLKATC